MRETWVVSCNADRDNMHRCHLCSLLPCHVCSSILAQDCACRSETSLHITHNTATLLLLLHGLGPLAGDLWVACLEKGVQERGSARQLADVVTLLDVRLHVLSDLQKLRTRVSGLDFTQQVDICNADGDLL